MIPPLLTGAIKGLAVAAGTVFATSQASKELAISAYALNELSWNLLDSLKGLFEKKTKKEDYEVLKKGGIFGRLFYSITQEKKTPTGKSTYAFLKHGAKFVAIAFLAKKILGPELKPLGLRAWGVGSNGLKASRLPGVFKWTVEKIPSPIKNAPILGRVFN